MIVEVLENKALSSSGIKPELNIGDKHKVKETCTCKCGQTHLDIGLVSKYNYISCYKCGEELPRGSSIHWCNSIRFNIVEE
jgi:hypothetical protein